MSEVRALFFADWRAFVNDGKRAVRSPLRLFIWLGYPLAAFALLVANRSATHGSMVVGAANEMARADVLLCSMLGTFAITLAFATGQLGFFRTRAEALLITSSSAPPEIAITYLQTRESLGVSLRFISSFVFFAFVVAPRHLSAFAAVADIVLFTMLAAGRNAIALPRRFAPPLARTCCQVVGGVLAVLIAEVPLRDLALVLPLPAGPSHFVRDVLPAWHPGHVLFAPSPLWFIAAGAVMVAGVALVARRGRDAYPDLYALSLARIDAVAFRAERLGRMRTKLDELPPVAVRIPAPPGPLVIVWKSVVEFRRQHRNARLLLGGAAVWVLLGFAIARFAQSSETATGVTLAVFGSFVTFVLSRAATATMTADLRRPLFWLSASPLFERVCALVAARNWRKTFTFVLIASGIAVAGGEAFDVLAVALLQPALAIFFTSVGLAIFALAPENQNVAAGLRLIASIVLLLPLVPVGIFAAGAGAPTDLAIIAVAILVESAALTAFATWRIDGRMDRLVA